MRISSILKATSITLETSEGDVELQLTEMSIADNERYIKLLEPYLDKKGNIKPDARMSDLTVARVMCSLKHLNGEYYFNGSIKDIKTSQYAPGMFSRMVDVLSELDPVIQGKTLESEKKPS